MSSQKEYTYPFLEEGKNPPFTASGTLVDVIHAAAKGDTYDKEPATPLFGIKRKFLNSQGNEVSHVKTGTLYKDVCTLWDATSEELTAAMQQSSVSQRGKVRALRNMIRMGLLAAHEGFLHKGEFHLPGMGAITYRKNKKAKAFWYWHRWEDISASTKQKAKEIAAAKATGADFEEAEEELDALALEIAELEEAATDAGIHDIQKGPSTWPIKVLSPSPKKTTATKDTPTPTKTKKRTREENDTDSDDVHRKLGYEETANTELEDKLSALARLMVGMTEAAQKEKEERAEQRREEAAERVKENDAKEAMRRADLEIQRKFTESIELQITGLKKDLERQTRANNSNNNNSTNNSTNNGNGTNTNNNTNNGGNNLPDETEEKDVGDKLRSHEIQLVKKARTAAATQQMAMMVETNGTVNWSSTNLGGMVPPDWIWRKLLKGERISFIKLITDMADGGASRRKKATTIDPLTNKLVVIDDDEDDEGDNTAESKDAKLDQTAWDRAVRVVINAHTHVWPLRKAEFEHFPSLLNQLTDAFGVNVARRYATKWLTHSANIQRINRNRDPDGTSNNPLVVSWKEIDPSLRDTVCHMARLVRCALCSSPDHDTRSCLTKRFERKDKERELNSGNRRTCDHFNRGSCTYEVCRFNHKCADCGGPHPRVHCKEYRGGYADKGYPRQQPEPGNDSNHNNSNPNNKKVEKSNTSH